MVSTTDGFFEVATESWPEWDLNPRPLYHPPPLSLSLSLSLSLYLCLSLFLSLLYIYNSSDNYRAQFVKFVKMVSQGSGAG